MFHVFWVNGILAKLEQIKVEVHVLIDLIPTYQSKKFVLLSMVVKVRC